MLVTKSDGTLDEEMSRGISREHFCLWIENDRLNFRVDSDNGAWVDGQELSRGDSVELTDRSSFSPFRQQPEKLKISTRFEVEHENVVGVTLTRSNS